MTLLSEDVEKASYRKAGVLGCGLAEGPDSQFTQLMLREG